MLLDRDFVRLRRYLLSTSGLLFDDTRRPAFSVAVAETARTLGLPDSGSLVALLVEPGARCAHRAEARQSLLDAVTIGETHFFRNPPQMDALRRVILPRLIRQAGEQQRPLTVWSAGCSTGEEPYTLAMLLLDLLGTKAHSAARVLGTDISAGALTAARAAHYGSRSVMMAAPADRQRWLVEGPAGWTVSPTVRNLVGLAQHNLAVDPPPFAPASVDLVVCRNVTIYFDRETTSALMVRFHEVLAPGGFLVLGHAESLWQLSDDFELVAVGDAFVYRRADPGGSSQGVRPAVHSSLAHGPRLPPSVRAARAMPTQRSPLGAGPRRAPFGSILGTGAGAGGAPTDSAVELLTAARQAQAGGRYAEAALLASRATASDPTLSAAYVVEGHALITINRDAEALVPLRKAAYLTPNAGDAHFLLAGAQDRLAFASAAAREYRLAAHTLRLVPAESIDAILEGRRVEELVALCEHLARRSARGDAGRV